MKIIIFPFAGGNKYSFEDYFPTHYNLSILEYPGRGLRMKENLIENIHALIIDLVSQLESEIISTDPTDQYVIYGHSMGALVGYLICGEIEKRGFKLPVKLIISGSKSPIYPIEKIASNLSDADFWDEVFKLGGFTEDLQKNPELIEYFTPILKADFKCVENYIHDENADKLKIPIDVFYGSDEDITRKEAEAWKEVTTRNVNVTQLKGNHFFIFDHKAFFIAYFKNTERNAII